MPWLIMLPCVAIAAAAVAAEAHAQPAHTQHADGDIQGDIHAVDTEDAATIAGVPDAHQS